MQFSSPTSDFSNQPALSVSEPRKSRPLNPVLFDRLLAQRQEIHRENEHRYPRFSEEVHALMPEVADNPEFRFVIRRLWMEYTGEMPLGWQGDIKERYDAFVRRFTWTPQNCARPNDRLLKKTLSVWQSRTVIPLSANAASSMIMEVERLADAGVEL